MFEMRRLSLPGYAMLAMSKRVFLLICRDLIKETAIIKLS